MPTDRGRSTSSLGSDAQGEPPRGHLRCEGATGLTLGCEQRRRVLQGFNPAWPVRYVKVGQGKGGNADGCDEAGCGGAAATLGAPTDPSRAARAPQSRARRTQDLGQVGHLTGLAGGTNKTRKLKFLLGYALDQGADTAMVIGAVQSNHAAACARLGVACELFLVEVAPGSGLLQLRVISQVLQAIARVCKSRISKRFPFPWLAACCTVLRSRWCQSGVKLPVSEHCIQPPASLRSSRSRLASSLCLPAQLSVFRWLVP
jgi:hypothetical protein